MNHPKVQTAILMLFAALSGPISSSAAPPRCFNQPKDLVLAIYGAKPNLVLGMDHNQFLEPLRTLLQQERVCVESGEVCRMDWDLWLGGQDGEVLGNPQWVESVSGASASVRMTIRVSNGGQSRKNRLKFELQAKEGCWLVGDVKGGNFSLTQILARESAAAAARR